MALLVRLSARSNYKLEIGKSNTIFPQSWNPEAVSVTSTPAYSMMFFFSRMIPYPNSGDLWPSFICAFRNITKEVWPLK